MPRQSAFGSQMPLGSTTLPLELLVPPLLAPPLLVVGDEVGVGSLVDDALGAGVPV